MRACLLFAVFAVTPFSAQAANAPADWQPTAYERSLIEARPSAAMSARGLWQIGGVFGGVMVGIETGSFAGSLMANSTRQWGLFTLGMVVGTAAGMFLGNWLGLLAKDGSLPAKIGVAVLGALAIGIPVSGVANTAFIVP